MTALHMHATTRYYALPGLLPRDGPDYHRGERTLHDRRGERKTIEVIYWPGGEFARGATFHARDTLPHGRSAVPRDGWAAAEWLDEGAVIAYHSRSGPRRYIVHGGVFREVRPRRVYARMGKARRRASITSDGLYWGLMGRAGR